jgi:hypothetical protein
MMPPMPEVKFVPMDLALVGIVIEMELPPMGILTLL